MPGVWGPPARAAQRARTGRALPTRQPGAGIDQYQFLSSGGTLWSWPGQNPFRWRDPGGRYGWEDFGNDFYKHSETAIDVSLSVSFAAGTIATGGLLSEFLGLGTLEAGLSTLGAEAAGFGGALLARGAAAVSSGAAIVGKGCSTDRGAANLTRPLQAADFGANATVKALQGTLSVQDKVATVGIKYVEGNLGNPITALNALKEAARQAGATTLRIEGTVANPRLEPVLTRILGPATRGAPGGPQDIWTFGL